MKKQLGYYNIDFTGAFIFMAVVGAVGGIGLWEFVCWAWPYIKAFIHAATV